MPYTHPWLQTLPLFLSLCLPSAFSHAQDLSDIYQRALNNDHRFQAAKAQYKAGLEAKKISRAGLLPTINAQGQWQDSETTSNSTNSLGDQGFNAVDSESESRGYTLSFNQPLFNLNAWNSFKAGAAQADAATATYHSAQNDLIIRSAEAYFNTLLAAANLQTSRAEENALNFQLQQSQQRYDVGLNAITEVHEAQAGYDSATAERLIAEGQLAIQFESLEVLTGKQYRSIASLKKDFPVSFPAPQKREQWVERALSSNPELQRAKTSAKAADYQARAAKSAHLPVIEFSGQYSSSSAEETSFRNPDGGTLEQDQESISITATLPLFRGGSISASRRQAKQQAVVERETYLQARRDITQQTRSEYLNVITGVATVNARKQTIISRQSALEATEAGYEVGTRDFVDVLNAQRGLYQAKRSYDSALYNYILSSLRLKAVSGMLNDNDIEELNAWLALSDTVNVELITE